MAREMILIPKAKYEQMLDKKDTLKTESQKATDVVTDDDKHGENLFEESYVQMKPKDFFNSKQSTNRRLKDKLKKNMKVSLKPIKNKKTSVSKQKWLTFHI